MNESYKLPKVMRYLCIGFQFLVLFLTLFAIWGYFEYNIIDHSLDAYLGRLSEDARAAVTYSDLKKTLLISLATVAYFAPVLILFGAFRVFQVFRTHDPFNPKAAKSVRFLGLTIVVYALSRALNFSLSVLLLTYDNPPGTKELTIAMNNQDMITLMIGAILIFIGHILIQAALIAEENRQFV